MENKPYFSIITPSFNRANLLSGTIVSVLNQEFKNWELIIIDDASTDNTAEIVESINDSRIIYVKNLTNKERGYSRNKGIALAKGEWICFLDSDDSLLPNHLQVFYDFITANTNQTPALLFSNSIIKNEATKSSIQKEVPAYNAKNAFPYLLQYTPNPTRVCIYKSIFNHFNFDESIPGLEDLDLWLHIATKFTIQHIPEYTNIYTVHADSYSAGDFMRFENELKNFKIIFDKKPIKGLLPRKQKQRLLSMCYFHLAAKYEKEKQLLKMYESILKSYWLFPQGYNRKTNIILLVQFLYNIPIIGQLSKNIKQLIKNKQQ